VHVLYLCLGFWHGGESKVKLEITYVDVATCHLLV
jgi:hypothetical protein